MFSPLKKCKSQSAPATPSVMHSSTHQTLADLLAQKEAQKQALKLAEIILPEERLSETKRKSLIRKINCLLMLNFTQDNILAVCNSGSSEQKLLNIAMLVSLAPTLIDREAMTPDDIVREVTDSHGLRSLQLYANPALLDPGNETERDSILPAYVQVLNGEPDDELRSLLDNELGFDLDDDDTAIHTQSEFHSNSASSDGSQSDDEANLASSSSSRWFNSPALRRASSTSAARSVEQRHYQRRNEALSNQATNAQACQPGPVPFARPQASSVTTTLAKPLPMKGASALETRFTPAAASVDTHAPMSIAEPTVTPDAPHTDAPHTDAPHTDAPHTDAPNTDARQTKPKITKRKYDAMINGYFKGVKQQSITITRVSRPGSTDGSANKKQCLLNGKPSTTSNSPVSNDDMPTSSSMGCGQ